MKSAAALALLAFGAEAPAQPLPDSLAVYDQALAAPDAARIDAAYRSVERTRLGRKLAAETHGLPRLSRRLGAPAAYRRSPAALLFDPAAVAGVAPWSLELSLVRELARASLGLPLAFPEEEMAARQAELEFALELARVDGGFERVLRSRSAGGARLDASDEIARVAHDLVLFAREPDGFYRFVERTLPEDVAQRPLAPVADLLAVHRDELARAGVGDGPYVRLGGRRYPAELARAAQALAVDNGLRRADEALAGFDGLPAQDLQRRAKAWLAAPF